MHASVAGAESGSNARAELQGCHTCAVCAAQQPAALQAGRADRPRHCGHLPVRGDTAGLKPALQPAHQDCNRPFCFTILASPRRDIPPGRQHAGSPGAHVAGARLSAGRPLLGRRGRRGGHIRQHAPFARGGIATCCHRLGPSSRASEAGTGAVSTRMRKCVSAHTDPKCCVRGPPPRGAVAMRGTSPPTATCGRASQRCARRLPGMEAIPGFGKPRRARPRGGRSRGLCAHTPHLQPLGAVREGAVGGPRPCRRRAARADDQV